MLSYEEKEGNGSSADILSHRDPICEGGVRFAERSGDGRGRGRRGIRDWDWDWNRNLRSGGVVGSEVHG